MALWTAETSVASEPILSAALVSLSAASSIEVALLARTSSSWASEPSAWLSMGAREFAVPTICPPTSAKESRADDICGMVSDTKPSCSSPSESTDPWMALLTVSERFLTLETPSLIWLERDWSSSILASWSSASDWRVAMVVSSLATTRSRSCEALALEIWRLASESRASERVLIWPWTVVLAARSCAMAASSLPWAQPMSPAALPTS